MWHEWQGENGEGFRSVDAATGEPFGPARAVDGHDQVRARCAEADAAFDDYRAIGNVERAAFLDRIGDEIFALGDGLIATAMRETGLPRSRLEGERGRTVGQLKMFAGVVRRGDWMGIRIDPAMPDRAMPRPDLRMRMIPIGPVAVFGASNFPLAFSTAGGDTASALAAGCPVVVKGHPAHPATSALVADAVLKAVRTCDMPHGVFGHLAGPGDDLGAELVQNPCIAAIGFTGSRDGGLALTKLAQARAVPIPIYAEMSSINPVILLPAALATRSAELADSFVASLTIGAGQFCTKPGLLLAIEGEALDAFVTAAGKAVAQTQATTMLTGGIHAVYDWGVAALGDRPGVRVLARGRAVEGHACGRAALFETMAESFLSDPALRHEMFGAAALIVRCRDAAQLREVLTDLEGQLTATMHMDEADTGLAAALLPLLERKAGRILVNGWPTGVEVTHAMVHGGPFPATSDARTTSVGSLAIDRFLRPVCYQNLPSTLLPAVLRDDAAGAPSIGD